MPPHLAGREREYKEFDRLLEQDEILENMVLTGLRGVGKTVLLETFKPRAMQQGWLWATADLSESASISETALAQRILADLSLLTSSLTIEEQTTGQPAGFVASSEPSRVPLSHKVLLSVYAGTPGLISDKIKATLEFAWQHLSQQDQHRVIFAYDEAQNLTDHAEKEQFPLSVLLDVFQSIQKKGIPFMLVLAGLPTLFPRLVDARTYAERMFRVVTLSRLNDQESREAVLKPIGVAGCPINFSPTPSTRSATSRGATHTSSSSSAERSSTSSSNNTRRTSRASSRSMRSSASWTPTSSPVAGPRSPIASESCFGPSPTWSIPMKNSQSRNWSRRGGRCSRRPSRRAMPTRCSRVSRSEG